MTSPPLKLTAEKSPVFRFPVAWETASITSPSSVLKLPRSITNEPVAPKVDPAKLNVIVSSVDDTFAKVKEPKRPDVAQLLVFGPTQKAGLAGSVWLVGPPNGLIVVLPVTDVVKLYVLPTIVALATGANARAKPPRYMKHASS